MILYRKNITNRNKNTYILENINISLKKRKIYILKGKNGSGKTSLLKFFNTNTTFNISNLKKYYSLLQLYNKLYINIYNLKYIYQINNNIKKLSYGFKKLLFSKLNLFYIKKLYYFDEPFNGLDSFFFNKLNYLFYKIYQLNSTQIKIYHNNFKIKNNTLIFLE